MVIHDVHIFGVSKFYHHPSSIYLQVHSTASEKFDALINSSANFHLNQYNLIGIVSSDTACILPISFDAHLINQTVLTTI